MTKEEVKKIIGKGEDLSSQKFERLLVLYPCFEQKDRRHGIKWHCKCDCGNECDVISASLKSGRTKSCGCLAKENKIKNISKFIGVNKPIKNLIGQKYGFLTVIEDMNVTGYNNQELWKCRCECGNICYKVGSQLKRNEFISCGCKIMSSGELKICDILNKNNIKYVSQMIFDNCRFLDTKALARFDFYIENKYIVEFDGKQHSIESKGWTPLKKTQEHDAYKNQWCKDNNIPIIRIPYTHYNDLCLEDLLLETSKFII